jgi:hypothetical protein
MPQPYGLAVRDSLDAAHSNQLLLPLAHILASVGWFAGGIACLWLRWQESQPGPILAVAGIVLVGCAVVQSRLSWRVWSARRHVASPLGRFAFWRLFALGTFVAYLATLALLGPVRHVAWAWLAAVCLWQTLLTASLDSTLVGSQKRPRSTRGQRAGRLAWLLYAPLVALVAGEVGLRAYRAAADHWPAGPPIEAGGSAPDGPSDVLAPRVKGARFRVAILGDVAGCGHSSGGYFERLEQAVPAVEVVSLASSVNWPGAGTSDLGQQVHRYDPDLVLAVVAVCESLSREAAPCGYFDWRQFELAGLLVGEPSADMGAGAPVSADSYESFLRALRPQLAACRTPIDSAMQARWNRVFTSLDEAIRGCAEARVPMAVVILPAEFQVNPALCETLLRRSGLSADRFDVELPQRRLAGYALERGVPLIDLLPHLRLCRQSVYERNSTSLSEEGDIAAASAIRGWLESRYGGQLAAQLSKTE